MGSDGDHDGEPGRGDAGRRRPALAYAALVRVPNLFTAPPDVVLGAALAVGGASATLPPHGVSSAVAGLALASVLLYAGGTSLNDWADAPRDARERPERPIPSGDVSRRAALALGVALLLGGIVAALVAAGLAAGAVAAGLAFLVVCYDVVVDGGPLAALLMGGARGANVLLGTAAGGRALAAAGGELPGLPPVNLAVPLVVLAYVAAVTYMAETEAAGGDRRAVLVAAAGALLAGVAVLGRIAVGTPDPAAAVLAFLLTLGFLAWTGRALRPAYADPVPATVGPAVGACVLALVVLDGAFAATVGPGWALSAVAFLVPAVAFARFFDVS